MIDKNESDRSPFTAVGKNAAWQELKILLGQRIAGSDGASSKSIDSI
jgi:hypothetical protein